MKKALFGTDSKLDDWTNVSWCPMTKVDQSRKEIT